MLFTLGIKNVNTGDPLKLGRERASIVKYDYVFSRNRISVNT